MPHNGSLTSGKMQNEFALQRTDEVVTPSWPVMASKYLSLPPWWSSDCVRVSFSLSSVVAAPTLLMLAWLTKLESSRNTRVGFGSMLLLRLG